VFKPRYNILGSPLICNKHEAGGQNEGSKAFLAIRSRALVQSRRGIVPSRLQAKGIDPTEEQMVLYITRNCL
jgi:hypothetical protein